MSHLPFTLIAYFFNALSVIASKYLLQRSIPEPLVYAFYISLFSLLALFLLPFTQIPNLEVFSLASLSTILWTIGAYFMFCALKIGQVSRVIPVIGTLIPLILLLVAFQSITTNQLIAILLLLGGMIFLTLSDWKGKFTKKEIIFEVLSSFSFALAYILLREVYLKHDFFSVIVWSRLILIPFILISYFLLKNKLFSESGPRLNFQSKTGLIFLGGQIAGVLSEFLILFSISLANPALVNSLQGTQYVFLFVLAREKYSNLVLIFKLLGIGLIGVGLYLLAIVGA